jgi:hypothetical protein
MRFLSKIRAATVGATDTVLQATGFSAASIKRIKFILGAVSIVASPIVAILPDGEAKYAASALLGLNGVIHMIDGASTSA